MIVPAVVLLALLGGAGTCWLVLRRPVPVSVPPALSPTAERAGWFRSARELYRTVQGVVADLDGCALAAPDPRPGDARPGDPRPGDPAAGDPAAARAWLDGAVTRARGAASWALALRDQAIGAEAVGTCEQVAAGMAALADAAWAALADPGDVSRARRVDAERDRARRGAERLVRLL